MQQENPSIGFLNNFAVVWCCILLISGHKNVIRLCEEKAHDITYNCFAQLAFGFLSMKQTAVLFKKTVGLRIFFIRSGIF